MSKLEEPAREEPRAAVDVGELESPPREAAGAAVEGRRPVAPTTREIAAAARAAAVASEPPLEAKGPAVGAAPEAAGGLGALTSTARHAIGQMGVTRTLQTLTRLNQKGGFDCQSCAWPDDDGDRDAAAFCENGAKAVADEATRARATPEFFAAHSVAELSRQSDHWLNQQGRLTHPMLLDEGATHYAPVSWREAFDLVGREL
ncbi:MAG TPA: hypothetical protein VFS00_27980, partial [Polyangiaceae bacterium]|nr:hypothetical protein [Polyangiaceae bacterium]